MNKYELVGEIITVNGVRYQQISYFNDVRYSDGWVEVDNWKDGKRPFYIFSDRELGVAR